MPGLRGPLGGRKLSEDPLGVGLTHPWPYQGRPFKDHFKGFVARHFEQVDLKGFTHGLADGMS